MTISTSSEIGVHSTRGYVRDSPYQMKIWNNMTIHSNAYNELFSGRVKLLIDEKEAKDALLEKQKSKKMGLQERLRYMEPYANTTLLVNETTNLRINRNNTYLKLEMIRTDAEKDTFSALEYGLWVISEKEKEYYATLRKPRRSIAEAIKFN